MKLLDKLQGKLGRFTIPHLIVYIIFAKAAVYLICLIFPDFYSYIYLDPQLVLQGQVWRLITFIFLEDAGNIFFAAIELYFYYFICTMLEKRWGSFKFNLYFLVGILCTIAASFIFNTTGTDYYVYESIFLAFATLFPNLQILLFFIIPIKVKWIGIVTAAIMLLQCIAAFFLGGFAHGLTQTGYILIVLLGYVLFFGEFWFDKIKSFIRRKSYDTRTTSAAEKSNYDTYQHSTGTSSAGSSKVQMKPVRHRCCICGLTDVDDPNMVFRYCSDCSSPYEYCANHIHNHIHK